MGRCLLRGEEYPARGARYADAPRTIRLVAQRDLSHLDVIGRRHGDVHVHGDTLATEMELGSMHSVGCPPPPGGRPPHSATLLVAQVQPPSIVGRRVGLEPRERQSTPG